jgi:flagellar biosynthetic protein FliR
MLGLAIGLALMILLSGMQLAGQIISQTSGMTLADVANPTFDTTVPLFSQILEMLATAVFFLVGGHRQVMDALMSSFTWMPPGNGRLPDSLIEALTVVTSQSFEVAIRASAPVLVSLLVATLIVALISRTLPQLNAVAVGLNFNSIIVMGMLALCLGSAAWVFQDDVEGVITTVSETFHSPTP